MADKENTVILTEEDKLELTIDQFKGLINKTHVIAPKETIKTAIDSLDGAYKFLAIHGLKELHPRTAQMLDDFRVMIKEEG